MYTLFTFNISESTVPFTLFFKELHVVNIFTVEETISKYFHCKHEQVQC